MPAIIGIAQTWCSAFSWLITSTGSAPVSLFMTQREERVDAARSMSRNETREQRHGREECRQAAKRDRIRGLDVEEQGLQESRQHQGPDQPGPYSENDDHGSFAQDDF